MSKSTEVKVKDEFELAERPEFLAKETSRGSEEVSIDDITIPRLSMIQDLSPYHKKAKEEYIEGAEVGDVFNTVTKELFKGEMNVIPVFFRTEYVVWKDRKAGGGFFGAFDSELEAKRQLKSIIAEHGGTESQYEIVDTAVNYVLLLRAGSTMDEPIVEQVVVSMSKSQWKPARKWNTMIKMAGGDRFSKIYGLKAVVDTNKAGEEYINWSVKPKGFVSAGMFKAAEELYEAVKAGDVKVATPDGETVEESSPQKAGKQDDFDDSFDG